MKAEAVPVAVLCGGLGTRLGPLTAHGPKPLVEILGKPFLEYQVDLLASHGFTSFLFLTGYRGEQISERLEHYAPPFRTFPLEMCFLKEESPMGTGGALLAARASLDRPFLLVNGDSLLVLDYGRLLSAFAESDATVLVTAYRNPDSDASVEGNNLALRDDHVLLYQKRGSDPRLTHVDSGVSLCRPRVFDAYRADDGLPLSFEETIWPRLAARRELGAFRVASAPWDIGTPERLAAFSRFIEASGAPRARPPLEESA